MSRQRRQATLAYRDREFLDSEEARPIRILAEYLGPLRRFEAERIRDTIVFFGSARSRARTSLGRYYADARELARLCTAWSKSLPSGAHRFIVCTGGGGGIMEAANRGASDERGRSIGLNIGLPHEQEPNRYVTRELSFDFHYFFMRKLWFAHLARAMVAFPGGFGTLDELMEMLTLSQTRKLGRDIPIVLYGTAFWKEVIDFDALVRYGTIAPEDLSLFHYADDPKTAFRILKREIVTASKRDVGSTRDERTPAFAASVTARARK